jgi:hypothetical protein
MEVSLSRAPLRSSEVLSLFLQGVNSEGIALFAGPEQPLFREVSVPLASQFDFSFQYSGWQVELRHELTATEAVARDEEDPVILFGDRVFLKVCCVWFTSARVLQPLTFCSVFTIRLFM